MTGAEGADRPAGCRIELGVGLTRLGRPWGIRAAPVPTDEAAASYLAAALALGVHHFDTAPSYGASERRLGRALQTLPSGAREALVVATKFGEQWDERSGALAVDHSYAGLARSLDESLRRLGNVDLIQLHRSSAGSLRSADVRRAFDHARAMGVRATGASVSTVDDARVAVGELGVDWLQFPYHIGNAEMHDAFALADAHGCRVLVNRPFGMGALVQGGETSEAVAAFRFICAQRFTGAILTGTVSVQHLHDNLAAFRAAAAQSLF